MSKFDFTDRSAAWKSISGKKWERPLQLADDNFRLFHDIGAEVEYHDYNADGKVLREMEDGSPREPIPGHLDNILGGWTEPFSRAIKSLTEVVEEEVEKSIYTDEMIAGIEAKRNDDHTDMVRREHPGTYSHRRYDEMVHRTFDTIRELARLKGGEYSGDLDRLANFRRNGASLDVPMELVWAIYANKHHDAIMQYIKDIIHDTARERSEPISGRVDDLIVYLLLFKAMIEEREQDFKDERHATDVIGG